MASEDKGGKHPRRRFYLPGTGQVFYGSILGFVVFAFFLGLSASVIWSSWDRVSAGCAADGGMPGCVTVGRILESAGTQLLLTLGLGVVGVLAAFYSGLMAAHRSYGPMIAFRRHISQLIKGEYSSRIKLRKDDHHQRTADLLNELAESLEKRHTGK